MKFLLAALVALSGFAAQAKVPVNPSITPNDKLPARVLDCGGSIITSVTGRFGDPIGDGESGSQVVLKNGAAGVSYDLVPEVKNSRVGDHVLVCLVFIPDPKNCPPGDGRGRVYTMTNLRTLQSWSLADSQHLCGGA